MEEKCPKCGSSMINGKAFGTVTFKADEYGDEEKIRWFQRHRAFLVFAHAEKCVKCNWINIDKDSIKFPNSEESN